MRLPLLALAFGLSTLAVAQPSDPPASAAYVTLLGADTLAVERFTRTDSGMEAEVILRSPRTTVAQYVIDLDGDGFSRYEATVRAPGEAEPVRREVVVPDGDSLRFTITANGETRTTAIAGDRSALPFIDMAHWPFDLMLERAPGTEQTVPLFTPRGILDFTVRRDADGTVTVAHPFRGPMTVRTTDDGQLATLDAGATTRALTVTRVATLDLDALAQRFAARDAAGEGFGPLSGRGETVSEVDGATITVDFGQPARRGRDIFGPLVAWGELWRTGANMATHFETDRDLMLGDLAVPAGRYTLFSIPEEDGGTLIVSRQTGQTGTAYDDTQDLGRIPMTRTILDEPVELFTIDVEPVADGSELAITWDRSRFSVPLRVAD